MVRGRGRSGGAVALGVLGALALALPGCGAESHSNDPRPAVASRISVTIVPGQVIVRPPRIAVGPAPDQQIPQNRGAAQPPIDTDAALDVVFVAANQTGVPTRLVVRGPADARSEPVPPRSPGTLQTELPSGTYTVSAPGVPGASPAKLRVGGYRASSENDILTP